MLVRRLVGVGGDGGRRWGRCRAGALWAGGKGQGRAGRRVLEERGRQLRREG